MSIRAKEERDMPRGGHVIGSAVRNISNNAEGGFGDGT